MNEQIKTVIVDDEQGGIDTLNADLLCYGDVRVVGTATNVDKAKKMIIDCQPDLLFLDVEMPKQSGFELLQDIRPLIRSAMNVVFYSAFDKYMIDALRASAFDYLVKPYRLEELNLIMERVRENRSAGKVSLDQSMRRLFGNERKFAMQTFTGLLLIRWADVLYFQYDADTRSWLMVLVDRTTHRLRQSVKGQEILNLTPSFLQISQDVILNADYLVSIENGSLHCVLCPPYSDIDLRVSRRYYSKIREQLEII